MGFCFRSTIIAAGCLFELVLVLATAMPLRADEACYSDRILDDLDGDELKNSCDPCPEHPYIAESQVCGCNSAPTIHSDARLTCARPSEWYLLFRRQSGSPGYPLVTQIVTIRNANGAESLTGFTIDTSSLHPLLFQEARVVRGMPGTRLRCTSSVDEVTASPGLRLNLHNVECIGDLRDVTVSSEILLTITYRYPYSSMDQDTRQHAQFTTSIEHNYPSLTDEYDTGSDASLDIETGNYAAEE